MNPNNKPINPKVTTYMDNCFCNVKLLTSFNFIHIMNKIFTEGYIKHIITHS